MQSSVHTSSVFLQEFDAVFGAQEGAALLEKFPLAAAAAQQLHRTAQDQLRLALQQLNRALEATGSAEAADVEGELSIELSGGLAGSELGYLSLAAGWAQSAALILAVKLSFELDRGAW